MYGTYSDKTCLMLFEVEQELTSVNAGERASRSRCDHVKDECCGRDGGEGELLFL